MPSKRNNKLTYQQAAKQRDWAEESRIGTVAEYFPEVESIEIRAHYTPELSWHGAPGDRNKSYSPDTKAFFKIDCPWKDCVAGGLELGTEVRGLIRDKLETKTHNTFCDGWQDESRVGRHKCFLKWSYSIAIEYQPANHES